jgi:L-malate glycosyltransferase
LSRKLRIAQIVPSLRATGPVNVAVDLTRELQLAGHDAHLFYLDNIIDQFVGDIPARLIDHRAMGELREFDIIHSHCLRPDFFVFRNRKKFRNVVKISTIHNLVHQDLSFAYNKIVATFTAFAWLQIWKRAFDALVVLNDFSVKYYSNYLPGSKLRRVYNGRRLQPSISQTIDEETSALIAAWRQTGKIVIGSCAALLPRKGLEQILSLLASDRRFVYLVVGDGPAREELQTKAISLNVSDRVRFVGQRKNVDQYLHKMDLFALPSRSEGLPLAALEATSIGLPVLCSDIDIFREIFSEADAAFFKLDDIASLVKAIDSMVGRLAEMGTEAKRRYLAGFTVERMAKNYLTIYDEDLPLLAARSNVVE